MTTLADGREVPDFADDIGVLAPGGGTRGMTAAGAAELTRQRTASMSLPTRALGMALGAAETLVPAVGSPARTLRQAAAAARDYILNGAAAIGGIEQGNLQPVANLVRSGYELGQAAAAGDPKAQGAALATAAALRTMGGVLEPTTTVTRHPMTFTPSLEMSAAAPGVLEAQATRAARRILDKPSAAASSAYDRMVERRAQRLAPPEYTGPKRRAVDVVSDIAALARKRQAELQARGFLGTGPESMAPADVLRTQIMGEREALSELAKRRAEYTQHTAETILPKVEP